MRDGDYYLVLPTCTRSSRWRIQDVKHRIAYTTEASDHISLLSTDVKEGQGKKGPEMRHAYASEGQYDTKKILHCPLICTFLPFLSHSLLSILPFPLINDTMLAVSSEQF